MLIDLLGRTRIVGHTLFKRMDSCFSEATIALDLGGTVRLISRRAAMQNAAKAERNLR